MSQESKDLRNAALYLVALLLLAGGLVFGGILVSQRVNAGAAIEKIISVLNVEEDEPDAPTKLSIAVENAREIRAALARQIPPPPPLPPITAKVAHGHFKATGKHHVAKSPPKLSREALNAMASANMAEPPRPAAPLPRVELHRVY
jgi:hypothetical protein